MENCNYLHGSLDNLKLISDDVWNAFDYDSEFKDVFANISRRESLLSHRFISTPTAEILSDLQYIVTLENQPVSNQVEPIESIFDGEIFKNKDGYINGHDNFSYTDVNQIENAYWDDVRTVGRQFGEVNVTYNNAFDPRLTFNGLFENQGIVLDDLERDITAQHNHCIDVEDVSDLADEYYNKYRQYLIKLWGSKKIQKKYKDRILACQPPKLSAPPPKFFDLKTCWETEDERKIAKNLNSAAVKNIWKDTQDISCTDDQKVTLGDDVAGESLAKFQMTPSPLPVVPDVRRTPSRCHEAERLSVEAQNAEPLHSTPSKHLWKAAWENERQRERTLPHQSHIHDGRQNNISEVGLKFDLEIINGNVKVLPRHTPSFNEENQRVRNSQMTCESIENQMIGRNTSKALSDTRVFTEEGKFIPVLTSTRTGNDRARSMRSESALNKVESCYSHRKSPQQSPRGSSRSNFASGRQQEFNANQFSFSDGLPQKSNIVYGSKEFYPTSDRSGMKEPGNFQYGDYNRTGNHVSQEQQRFQTNFQPKNDASSKESKFFNTLKQYGWFEDNFGAKKSEKKQEMRWVQNTMSERNPSRATGLDSDVEQSSQTPKRQLFKTQTGYSTERLIQPTDLKPETCYFSRSKSMSPVKRQALQNSSFSSQCSSPNTNSQNSSLLDSSSEPHQTSSQLNAASEPFVPARLQNPEVPKLTTPTKIKFEPESSPVKCQTPNKEAIKKLLQSPEILAPLLATNDAKQAYLIQLRNKQIRRQVAAQAALNRQQQTSPLATRGPTLHSNQSPQSVKHQMIPTQPNVGIFNQNSQQPQTSFPPQHLHHQLSHRPPIVRGNTIVPQWPCPHPPVSRHLNFGFPEPRPRTVLPQRYGPPLIAWQFPGYPNQPRLVHQFYNVNNNSNPSGSTDDLSGYSSASSESLTSVSSFRGDQSDDAVSQPTARSVRPIRANSANLIHISTK
ncbi:hypothetical protein LOTGIDRAFT_234698 [Lottia gigantea]|uniref:Uncharacterized protein n=1 Tax=Lottia gigantea TaxID=225164 RepID=V3ZUT5_LOTGI|nr:hypothetical protein LOTGIDRAFT_234698 [Lottia gigantea]ESO88127.1 hypothetical protein LOTGIDRAFT_234698 [Lottia gigantea]